MFADFCARLRLKVSFTRFRGAGALAALTLAALAYSGGEALAQPVIGAVTPNTVTYGITPSTQITISGSGFQVGATITVGSLTGTTVAGSTATATTPFVFVAANALRFYWPNTSLPPSSYDVVVTNPDTQADTASGAFTVNAPQPTVTSLTPPSATYGITPSQSVTITGTNFVLGATITVGTLSGPTVAGTVASAAVRYVWVNSNTLRFWWPNADLPPASYAVQVSNPSAAGGLSGSLAAGFTVIAPVPTVTNALPSPVTYGIFPSQSITISGTNFVVGATITVGTLSGSTVAGSVASAAVRYVWVNSNTLRFWWPNTDLPPASYTVQVANPSAAGGQSGSLAAAFTVVAPLPTVTSALPNPVTYGIFPSQSITVAGTNFVLGATITVGTLSGPTVAGSVASAATPFVFVSSSTVRFWWPNTSLAPNSYDVQVTNPSAAGGLSATLAGGFTVSGSQPVVSVVTPPEVTYGGTSLPITVSGSNFILGAQIDLLGPGSDNTVRLTGTTVAGTVASPAQPFIFASATRLGFYWDSAAASPLPLGQYRVRVTNPAAAGGLSGTSLPDAFEVLAAVPTIAAALPTQVIYDIVLSRAITITGTNFVEGATILIDTPSPPVPPGLPACLPANCSPSVPTVLGTAATAATPYVFIRSTQLSFYWPNRSLTPGAYQVTVVNPPEAGGRSVSVPGIFTVVGPTPVIASVTPSSVEYNDTPSTSVRITGAFFYEPPAGNPSPDPSFVTLSSTADSLQYSCVFGTGPATATTRCVHTNRSTIEFYWVSTDDPNDQYHLLPGDYAVTVTNPGYAGARSSAPLANGFRVTAPQPQIVDNGIRPRAVTAGITPSRSVDIVGVNDAAQHLGFVAGAAIRVVNPDLPPLDPGNLSCIAVDDAGTTPSSSTPCVFVGPGLLRFYWDTDRAADSINPLLGPGTYNVTVTNPATRGELTDTLAGGFRVTSLPELIEVAPTTGVGSGARSAVITLTTAGFSAGSVVRIGAGQGDPQITMRSGFRAFASGDGGTVVIDVAEDPAQTADRELDVTITSADGLYTFTCPDPAGAATCDSGLVITPSPVVTSITSALVGTSERTLTITGDRFVAPVAVTLPTGVSGTCTARSVTTITCRNVANASPGSWPVIVTNPDGGRTTGTWTIAALPVISSITPGSGAAGGAVPVRITGSGFQAGTGFTFGTGSGIDVTNETLVNSGTVDATFVIAAGAADGYRTLTATNLDGGVAIASQAFYVGTLPADAASVFATYGEQDQSLVQYQRSFGSGWSARLSGPALASPPVWQVMKASPVRDERLLAVMDDQRRLTLHVWTGQMWTGAIDVSAGNGAARPTQTMDVAFEQQSGRGMAVYATADTTLKYRIWDGATWTAEARVEDLVNGQPTNGRPVWVRLEARPGTNDLLLVYGDQNNAVAAAVWRGSRQRWEDAKLLTSTAASHDAPVFDVAFEHVSGRGVVVWATGTETTPHYQIWTRDASDNGGWLASEGTAPSVGSISDPPIRAIRLVGDLSASGDRLALASSSGTEGRTLQALIWTDAQWSSAHVLTANLVSEDSGRGFDVSAEGASGDFVFVYHTVGRPDGASQTFSAAGTWSVETDVALPVTSSPPTTTLTAALTIPDSCDPSTDPTCNPQLWLNITVAGGSTFPATGVVILEAGTSAVEAVRYISKQTSTSGGVTTTRLTGLTRGTFGTAVGLHAAGAPVLVQPTPAWTQLAGARGIDDLALGVFDTLGRVSLARSTGASWSAAIEAQPSGSGLVSVFDQTLGRTTVVSGKGVAVTLAQHLRRTSTGDTIPPGTPTLSVGTVTMNSVGLSWTAMASDGLTAGGSVASYELRQVLSTTVTTQVVPASQAPGGGENYTVVGLSGGKTYQFDIRAIDAAGNRSLVSNRVTVATPAATPPSVTDLAIAADSIRRTSVTLVWTRPLTGSDNAPLSYYIVKYKTGGAFASEQEFDAAQPELRAPATSLTVDGLQVGETYWFAVKVVDAFGASSAMSNVVQATTADHPPDPISDLRIIGAPTTSSVTLRWTMPADDSGAIASYITKYTASSAIGAIDTEAEFSLDDADGVFTAGQPTRDTTLEPFVETLVVTGLTPGTRYWFSVKAVDADGQLGPLSGSPEATTSTGATDTTAPDPITDLVVVATSTSSSSLTVAWTATGDDGTVGNAAEYDVRYATFPLTDENFEGGIGVPAGMPEPPGTREQLTLAGLSSNTQYFLAIKVIDDDGNSALSNVAVGQTGLRSGYTLVSIPRLLVAPNNSMPGVFRDDVGSTLTVYRWNSAGVGDSDGCYDGYPMPYSLDPYVCSSIQTVGTGLGYYLYNATVSTNGTAILDAVGDPVTVPDYPTYDIQLELGFNMVGNPYERDIHLGAVAVKRGPNGTPVTYQQAITNGWVGPSVMLFDGVVSQPYGVSDPEAIFKPWNGGWIQSFVIDAILVFSSP